MTAQNWLNTKYPLNQRSQIEEINNSYGGELTGELIIENFPNLKRICLEKNKKISKLIIRNCSKVKKIDVSNNQVEELVIDGLKDLEHLNCSNNQLRFLNVSQNVKLKTLVCFGNSQLKKENVEGIEKLTQLTQFNGGDDLKPIYFLQEQFNNLIINAQKELGVENLHNLPLIPEGETLYTLLQRLKPEKLEKMQNELNIEKDHSRNMDSWYRRLINEGLGNELLQSLYESKLKSKSTEELKEESEIIKQLAEMEIKDNLKLFTKIQDKKNELKQLKTEARSKLENDTQKIFLKNLLTAQEQFIYLEDTNQQARLPSERLLRSAKQKLSSKLDEEAINSLCNLQTEIVKLGMELEQIKKDKLEAKIEVNQFPQRV